MSGKLQAVRGTHDILPEDARKHDYLVRSWLRVAELYGYGRIETPIFEFSEVFHRTLGDTSDVVSKETYTFEDRGGESLTLRPEFTASVVRAFISEGKLQNALPLKFFYSGPAFRYERPQKGRMRQFHQIGVELLGAGEPSADVEVIALARQGLEAMGLGGKVRLELNSLGDAESRSAYRDALVAYFTGFKKDLSEDSQHRLERNPLRILDSKDEGDRKINAGAPKMEEFFTAEARDFFANVTSGLEALGIDYKLNPKLVRGLDYYNHSVFEFIAEEGLGAQNTVLAGGRYDGLVEQMGGTPTPGIGFAAGIERMLTLMDFSGVKAVEAPKCVAVVPVGESAEAECWRLAQELRAAGVPCDVSYRGNVGKRMKRADKIGAAFALMLGDDEIAAGEVAVKNLATGEQKNVARADVLSELSSLTSS